MGTMARILIVYATFDGQTRLIANALRTHLETDGHAVTLRDAFDDSTVRELGTHDATIVGGAVRYGRVSPPLEKFVRKHAAALSRRPGVFYAVCLCAGGPGAKPAEARKYVDTFLQRTGWAPQWRTAFAGALLYTKYGFFRRLMMRFIVGRAGGDTDTSRDHEYTDWGAVRDFASSFSRAFHAQSAAA
jgi:menaquinone-dependent protoporphyrinogen oxidase